jgi:N-sulfoglucosamine sulfohydrolase
MKRRDFIKNTAIATLTVPALTHVWANDEKKESPNILWIMLEDWCPDLSCYGTKGVHTPNIDKLASAGIRYTHAFTTAPVCSASRSAMLTGHYQNYTHTNQHRTKQKDNLPYGIKPIPALLSEAGYFTARGCGLSGKTDHNFSDSPGFTGKHWSRRGKGQPFFAQSTETGTHRSWNRDPERPIDEKDVELPPYYPDVPMMRRDWANGLEQAQISDRNVGKLLDQLETDGLKESTMVILIGDHGRCMPRGKQFLYDGGIHIPLIIRWPGHIEPGTVCGDLVNTLDVCRTIVDVTGVKPPHPLHGLNLFGPEIKKRKYIFAARDKMDSTHDAMRAVRTKNFKYIRNLMPERPYCQFNAYKEKQYPSLAVLNAMNLQGKLNPIQAAFMAPTKPEEELYDLRNDPWETTNLANDPKFADVKKELSGELDNWRAMVKDKGVTPEFRADGWPATYPTKTKEQWEAIVERWKPWVFRKPGSKGGHAGNFVNQTALVKQQKQGKRQKR